MRNIKFKDGPIAIGRMGDMMRTIQAMSDKTDDIILETFLPTRKEKD